MGDSHIKTLIRVLIYCTAGALVALFARRIMQQ